jgi:ABC-2 type transport system permease protein
MTVTTETAPAPAEATDVPGTTFATIISDGWTVARRNIYRMARNPEIVMFSTIMPIMFIVLFVYVFRSIPVPGMSYETFVMAGIFGQTVVFNSANTGVGLAEDIQKGIIDRFRSLPMSRSAVLVGRTISDFLNNVLVMAVMLVVGLLVGWRPDASVPSVTAGILMLLGFSYVFSWISATIGLTVKSVEVANSAGFVWMFPLTFISNVFVDPATMPSFFRVIAEWNPMSALVGATRELFGNTSPELDAVIAESAWPIRHAVLTSILWMALILAVFIPLSIRQYKKAASR